MSALNVAALQLTSTEDVSANVAACAALARAAAAAGASLIGLPENFAYLGTDRDHHLALAEALPEPGADRETAAAGPILATMQALARETGAWLLLGGFPERASPTHIRNTSVLLRADGTVAATYRKIHLFDVDVPGGKRFRESETIEAGNAPVVVETPWAKLGLSICYDLRFPELYRALVARGARLVAVPSAFTLETGKDHWRVLLRARAIENQAYVFAPAQFGHHGGDRRSWGHAMVVDPWGAVIAECGDHAGFALAAVDFAYQDRVRASLPCLTHRKVRSE
ncbi:MAG TPA: carbon-nitrogen hydrolase family protein [Polyangia bacterium]|jgi:predicted amidohydrolase|nr:carbon-nitrogen hydrolase family protein [Polyangia bacterium]